MAKRVRQKVSYVLEVDGAQPAGHRKGVDALAVDRVSSKLYTGGREGCLCAWNLDVDLSGQCPSPPTNTSLPSKTTLIGQVDAHSGWINDLCLMRNNSVLVSAAQDQAIKVWRPSTIDAATDRPSEAVTIGRHADYAMRLSSPSDNSSWIASAGLDRRVYLWDLDGKGKVLEINTDGEEAANRGSLYAMCAKENVIAYGGPERIVHLWDPRANRRVSKFVGHTDMVRTVLINDSGDMILSGSSDCTVKVWSVTAGRVMHTLTMHDASVFALASEAPDLSVFHSADRDGWLVKTDVRQTNNDFDHGLSVAVAKEHTIVQKLAVAGGYIWAATEISSIRRWKDVDTSSVKLPEPIQSRRKSIASKLPATWWAAKDKPQEVTVKSILRISNTAPEFEMGDQTGGYGRKSSLIPRMIEPVHADPDGTIPGQFGLAKHKFLRDRRRVLTIDTAGDVALWDIVECKLIRKYGKKSMDDVAQELYTSDVIDPWCSVDVNSGSLSVTLDTFDCFDGEVYADEQKFDNAIEFREDQRINLGKWVLRYLFAGLIDEELRRDEAHRQILNQGLSKTSPRRANAPGRVQLPANNSLDSAIESSNAVTPRANGSRTAVTPGLGIAMATPGLATVKEGKAITSTGIGAKSPQVGRNSQDDYFANKNEATPGGQPPKTPAGEGATAGGDAAKDQSDDKEGGKSPTTALGKKFRMGMSFGSKKAGRSTSATAAPEKPAVVTEDKATAEGGSETSSTHEPEQFDVDDNLYGVIQQIRHDYDALLVKKPGQAVESLIRPSLPEDTPVLKLRPSMKVVITEETSGGRLDLYSGTVGRIGADTDLLEKCAPTWLGEALLLNRFAVKDQQPQFKVNFVLHPYKDLLPALPPPLKEESKDKAGDGGGDNAATNAGGNTINKDSKDNGGNSNNTTNNGAKPPPEPSNRLAANRMLRVKKILTYVAEKIDPKTEEELANPDRNALKPEEYLEMYCNDQLIPLNMTLSSLRTNVWKKGSDVVMHYKANGRKEVRGPILQTGGVGEEELGGGDGGEGVGGA